MIISNYSIVVQGGKAQSSENKSYGYIDSSGKAVIEPIFGEALQFSEGLAAVRTRKSTVYGMGDSWGYIDQTGCMVINSEYNEARPFNDGKAMVHQGGELVERHDAPFYWNGGTWWLIDRTGRKLCEVGE